MFGSRPSLFGGVVPENPYTFAKPKHHFPTPRRPISEGSLSPAKRSIGQKLEAGTAQALRAAGVGDYDAARWAGKLFGAFNDLTPLGNVTGADEGAGLIGKGVSRGDLKTGLLGAGIFGLNVLPFGSKAARPLKSLLNDTSGAIRAWHGSPHDFDKFDMSKIGTGEGAQAYGHGLYFAENRAVADDYRNTLANPLIDGREMRLPEMWAYGALKHQYGDDLALAATKETERAAKGFSGASRDDLERLQDRAAVLRAWQQHGLPEITNNGRLYEVNINAEPEDFLDWDRPLSEQSLAAKAAERFYLDEGFTRREMRPTFRDMERLSAGDWLRKHPGTSNSLFPDHLLASRIPGIRYLDQGSRIGGQGTSNYVVFDDRLIDILNKY